MTKNHVIVSYPKSGITWLTHLVSDYLQIPQQDMHGGRIHYWGDVSSQIGEGVVRKSHAPIKIFADARYTLLIRDPRDVAVAAHHYLGIDYIEAMTSMKLMLPYLEWHRYWLESADKIIRYEELRIYTPATLVANFKPRVGGRLDEVIGRHSFDRMRVYMKDNHFMRKGIIGDWKNYFNQTIGKQFEDLLGEYMRYMGYTDTPDWWKELPE